MQLFLALDFRKSCNETNLPFREKFQNFYENLQRFLIYFMKPSAADKDKISVLLTSA